MADGANSWFLRLCLINVLIQTLIRGGNIFTKNWYVSSDGKRHTPSEVLLRGWSKITPLVKCLAALRAVAAFFILLAIPGCIFVSDSAAGVTVDDLVGRTVIDSWSVSPNGKEVAFLTIKAIARQNIYEITLYVTATIDSAPPTKLVQFTLAPKDTLDADTHALQTTVSQYVWSADSAQLLYTAHAKTGMELRVWNVMTHEEMAPLVGHDLLRIESPLEDPPGWQIKTFDTDTEEQAEAGNLPKDMSLLVTEGYRFFKPLENPKRGYPWVSEAWQFDWEKREARAIPNTRVAQYWGFPSEYSWNGHSLEYRLSAPLPPAERPQARADASKRPRNQDVALLVDIEPNKTKVRVEEKGETRTILEDDAILVKYHSERTDRSRDCSMDRDKRIAVMLRATNLIPNQLMKLDLTTGKMVVLFSPNQEFAHKTRGIQVRFIPIPVAGGLSGHLYLPSDYHSGKRYPLLFTTYVSNAGFNAGSGEVPILSLVGHGIAVFALDALRTNETGHAGDFGPELRRLDRPLEAMEWVIKKLAGEGLIDPERVGLNGLSYGTEISMYSYWKSDAFRAVSATTGAWEPILYTMAGIGFSQFLHDRGFSDPNNEGAFEQWKELSAGQNAQPTLPPLLWQAPDQESTMCIESWFRLRQAGAQVEWLEYPDEGHTKRNPANIWWVLERNLDWFSFWLKDEEDPNPAKREQYERWRRMRSNWETAKTAARVPQ